MVQAYVLAAELRGSRGDLPEASRRYEQRLADVLRSKQDAARGLGASAPKNRFQLAVRNGVMRLTGVPPAARPAMGRSVDDAIELPEPAACPSRAGTND